MYGIFEDDYKEDEYNVESQLKAWWRISDLLAEFPKPTEILDRSLCNLRRLVEHPMEPIEVSWDDLSYLMFCPKQWVSSQYDAMKKTALVRDVATGFEGASFTIAPDGWARLDELAKKRAESKQAFVAMWFADEMAEVYDKGIKPAIEDAGFDTRQMAFIQHNDDICDVIVAEIRKSRFIVADFSAGKCAKCGEECEHSKDCKDKVRARGGVYFEAGFAMGLGIPVIWTVRKEQLEQIHFDIRQYNFVAYGDAEDLRVQLKNRIGATIQ